MSEKNIDYSYIDKKVDLLIVEAKTYLTNEDKSFLEAEIKKAYIYAREAHEGQNRLSGEPYIIHPVESTELLMSLRPDIHTIQACLLHDVIEDTDRNKGDIEENF
jgi:(p)ppGpp synthase/HD superfamily hydrolase